MLATGKFSDKRILVIDKNKTRTNDRTWCFWETEPGFFDHLVFRQWPVLDFISDDFERQLNIEPYQYKMIRGEDFYRYCFAEIEKHPNVEFLYGDLFIDTSNTLIPQLSVDQEILDPGFATVFNSIYIEDKTQQDAIRLLQHFKGWVVECKAGTFNPAKATLMDFRVHQDHGTAFTYVLPFSDTRALIEYTLFTKELLPLHQYNEELDNYIKFILDIDEYKIIEEEFGIIPMTNEKFSFYRDGMYHLGTAGGQTKGSSGYTFQFIQKHSDQVLDCLLNNGSLSDLPSTPRRFLFYDDTLLKVLYYNRVPGKKIFTELFRRNKPQQVLKFLDNETAIGEEVKIISTLPTMPFLKTVLRK